MHNTCWTCAHQLMCERTTAVGRLTKLYLSTTLPYSSKDFSYMFQRPILYASIFFVPIVPLCHVALFIFPLARWHSGTSGTNSPIHLLQQLFLYFQLTRHEAREKEVSLASKEGILLSQLIHFLMA